MREKKIPLWTSLLLCVLAAGIAVLICYLTGRWDDPKVGQKLRQIDSLVSSLYVGETEEDALADYAAYGYMTAVSDKWSQYISAQDYAGYKLTSEGQTCGIGLEAVQNDRDNTIRVAEVFPDSPAEKAGIEYGDYILGADGVTCEKDGAQAVMDAVVGEEGTEVSITVRRTADGSEHTDTLTRAIVEQRMASGKMLENGIGYLRINNFRVNSSAQYQTALDSLLTDGAEKLVIDVRHNGGGRVAEMSTMLDSLLGEGTIMTLRSKNGIESEYTSDAEQITLPVVVLVDESSISAAEFFAAVLQEYGRAKLVGTHTTGKGRAQTTYELSDGSALVLSTEEYFTPQGKSLADTGIAPDETVNLSEQQQENYYFLTPQEDPQLQKALELLR